MRLTVNDPVVDRRDGQRDAVDGDRALVHDVARQVGRQRDAHDLPVLRRRAARSIRPVPSTWPWTRWPPSRPSSRIGRSRLTGSPARRAPRQLRSRVSRITSAVNVSPSASTTVRQTPLTAIESPCRAPSTTSRPAHASAGRCRRGRSARSTSPSSSTMPVNIRPPSVGAGRAVTRTSGPIRVTSVISSRTPSASVPTPVPASDGEPRRRAASAPGRRRPGRRARPAGTRRPGSGRPRAARAAGPVRTAPSSSAARSTRPSGPLPSSAAVATQVGAASSRTRAPAGVRPWVSTTTRSGWSATGRPSASRTVSCGSSASDRARRRRRSVSHSARSRCASSARLGRGDPAAGAVGVRPPCRRGSWRPSRRRTVAAGVRRSASARWPLRPPPRAARSRPRPRRRAAARPPPAAAAVGSATA